MENMPECIIKKFQKSSIEQIELDKKNSRSITQSQSGTESESSKDYVGRVAFEFFQNAVDRATENIWMELVKNEDTNEFIISNDGVPFGIYEGEENNKKSDFYGLNNIHNGTKTAGESIGNKGVGFKSCWNVSSHVIIESKKNRQPWGFELFNPVNKDKFSELTIKNAITDAGGVVPSFYFPKYYKSNEENFKEHVATKITIKLKDKNAYDEIKNELEEFQKAHFFFLKQLKDKGDKNFKIHIKIDSKENTLKSKYGDWEIISLRDKNTEIYEDLKKARKKETYKNIPEEPNIAIAFPPISIEKDIDARFYTYLPTKAQCGFNILIHGDFALDNARVSIPDNDYNNKILEIAAKLFIDELLNNTDLHKREDFGKFLIPHNKNDKFAKIVWNELLKENNLTTILKKVYTEETHFPEKSYEIIFEVIKLFTKERSYGAWREGYYNEIYDETIKYFCNKELFIVYIDENNKTFLPPKKETKEYNFHLFYKSQEDKNGILDFNLLQELPNLRISAFDLIGKEEFIKNNIVRKFSTLEILRALKDVKSVKVLKFIQQLLDNTKEELSIEVKKQLLEIKLPINDSELKEVKYCYTDIDDEISSLFNDDFVAVNKNQLQGIENINEFLKKIGVAFDRLPYVINNQTVQLPFKDECNFPESNLLKDFITNSLEFLDDEMINQLKTLSWFYDERKEKLFTPEETFLFKEHDNRKIESIAQEKKSGKYKELYLRLHIDEIEDTMDENKLIIQLDKMKDKNIDSFHQNIYKKITTQLAKIYKEESVIDTVPLLVVSMKNNEFKYINEDRSSVVFLETKYKKYKEQIKENYEYIGYFDTNIAHSFIKKTIGIDIFNPNYILNFRT